MTLLQVCTIIWIGLIVYKTGLVEHLTNTTQGVNITYPKHHNEKASHSNEQVHRVEVQGSKDEISWSWAGSGEDDKAVRPVEHTDLELWKQLSYSYWPTLFSYYNISVYGR